MVCVILEPSGRDYDSSVLYCTVSTSHHWRYSAGTVVWRSCQLLLPPRHSSIGHITAATQTRNTFYLFMRYPVSPIGLWRLILIRAEHPWSHCFSCQSPIWLDWGLWSDCADCVQRQNTLLPTLTVLCPLVNQPADTVGGCSVNTHITDLLQTRLGSPTSGWVSNNFSLHSPSALVPVLLVSFFNSWLRCSQSFVLIILCDYQGSDTERTRPKLWLPTLKTCFIMTQNRIVEIDHMVLPTHVFNLFPTQTNGKQTITIITTITKLPSHMYFFLEPSCLVDKMLFFMFFSCFCLVGFGLIWLSLVW